MRSLLTRLLCIALAIPAVPGGGPVLARTTGTQVAATECCPDDAGSCGDTADCDSGQVCAIRCATPTTPASLPAGTVSVTIAGKITLVPFAVATAPPDPASSPPLRPPRFPTLS